MLVLYILYHIKATINSFATSLLLLGLATVSVPHGLDGFMIRLTDPSRSGIIPISRTDGELPDVDPSNTVIVRPLTAVVQAGRNELRQHPMTMHQGNEDKRQLLVLCESTRFLSRFSLLPVHHSVFTLTSSLPPTILQVLHQSST
jgi:hypothetical protein